MASDFKTIVVETPSSIDLESPGGILSDTTNNVIYTTFPYFNGMPKLEVDIILTFELQNLIHLYTILLKMHWKIKEFYHFRSSEEWFLISNENSYQYPYSGAGTLLEGSVYGWQIKVEIPTTSGPEDMFPLHMLLKLEHLVQLKQQMQLSTLY